MRTVCIPVRFRPEGGGFYFLEMLAGYLARHGWAVTRGLLDSYDVLFTNHWMLSPRRLSLGILRNPRARVVQRIDGIAAEYGRGGNADRTQALVNRMADLTIFQSEYCRYSAREKWKLIVGDGPVIYNPVDVEQFRPDGSRLEFSESTRVACVTWSTNPRKGAGSVYALARANPDIGFVLCGRYPDAPALPNVHCLGVLGRPALAEALRSCDVLVSFSENEACPNHVLEAMMTGLPILYRDSGAMAEVVDDGGLPVTVESFRDRLAAIMRSRDDFAGRALRRARALFHPDATLCRYSSELQALCELPPAADVVARYIETARTLLSGGRAAPESGRDRSRMPKVIR